MQQPYRPTLEIPMEIQRLIEFNSTSLIGKAKQTIDITGKIILKLNDCR